MLDENVLFVSIDGNETVPTNEQDALFKVVANHR